MNGAMQLFDLAEQFDFAGKWEVKRVGRSTADRWFGMYHYSGTSGTVNGHVFGVYAGDAIALVALGPSANKDGLSKKFGLESFAGNVEIVRVAVHPDAPKNTASRSVALVCQFAHQWLGLEWVFSYADTGQGHHGGIYQALNAIYVGMTPARHGYLLDGKPIHPRAVVHMFGTESWVKVSQMAEARGRQLVKVPDMNTPKHTYILPIAGPATRRKVRKNLESVSMPYPKPDSRLESTLRPDAA